MMRSRALPRDDAGASLIMAMMFVTGVGLVVAALLTYGSVALSSLSATATSAQSAADVEGAMQGAINDIRNSDYANDGTTTCWPGGSAQVYAPLTAHGLATTVTCSPVASSGAGGDAKVPINAANRPANAILTMGRYWVGAAAGTPVIIPRDVTLTPPAGTTGSRVVVSGSNFAGAAAIQIGTAAEIASASGTTLLPCSTGDAATGCFTANGNELTISAMPTHAAGTVRVKVITVGASATADFLYASVPAAPATPTAVAGPSSATVTWSAPATGGLPITGYVVIPFRNGIAQPAIPVPAPTTTTPVPGLTIGASYTFTVAAVNEVGTGPASPASAAVVPVASVPAAPTIGTASASTLAAIVRWTAPVSDGGSAVTGYVVTPYLGTVAQTPRTFASTATTQTITGLTAGASYTFTVTARNAIGSGPPSARSNAVTVNASPVLTFPNPLPSARWGQPYSYQLTSTGGTEPFTWSLSAGSLPNGLSLNASTGVISGTASCFFLCGTSSFTVRLTDAAGATTTKATSISVTWFAAPGSHPGPAGSGIAGPGTLGLKPPNLDHDPEAATRDDHRTPVDQGHDPLPAALRDHDPRRTAVRGRKGPPRHAHRRGRSASRLTTLVSSLVAVGITATALVATTPGVASAAGAELFNQPFHNNTANGSGGVALPGLPGEGVNVACLTASGNPSTGELRSCATASDAPGSGKLRLTDNTTFQTGGLFAASSVPMSLGLDLSFNLYQYGSSASPADGIAFVLSAVDPAVPVSPENIGYAGGALGYAAGSAEQSRGLAHGYLGIGFDVYGNFSSNAYQGSGCGTNPGYISNGTLVPGQVVVRGPGHGLVGYCGLNSTATSASPPSPSVPLRAATRAASRVPVQVVINPTTATLTTENGVVAAPNTYQVIFTPVGQAKRSLSGSLPAVPEGLYPKRWLNAGKFPKQVAFGWVGSTGASVDFHEVDDARVSTLGPLPAPTLFVSQTAYTAATLAPGDPVSYEVVTGVLPGSVEPVPIVVTETLPTGVRPVGGSGSGWDCEPPVGQTITCTNTNVPFPADSVLPPLTITATVTANGITPLNIQNNSIVAASSRDADTVYGSETGLRNSGENPLRIDDDVYSNSTIVSQNSGVPACTDSWPLAPERTDCNGMYVNGSVLAERTCTGTIMVATTESRSCSTGTHTAPGDDPAIAAPASYAQPTSGMARQALPTCVASTPVVTFTPGYYDDAVGLSALMGGAASCRNKTFWFQPGVYYFDFHNAEMPTSGSPAIPYGSDVWTFNDATSVMVGGTRNGWTTGGVTAANLPGACVSPLSSTSAAGVQFVFGSDSRFHQQAGSVELCGSYSATKPPITVSGATGAGGSGAGSATLRPSAMTAFSTPSDAPTFTPVTSVTAIVSQTDGEGPTVTNLPPSSSATLRVSAVSGQTAAIPARSLLDTATITIRHGERNATVGTTLKLVFQPTRADSAPITRYLPVSMTSGLTYKIDTVNIADELGPELYAFGSGAFTLDAVLTTSDTPQNVTAKIDYLRLDLTWRTSAIRAQSGCVITAAGCPAFQTSTAGALTDEIYLQGTVYLPKAKVQLAVRYAEAPVIASGVIARALVVRSDAYAGSAVYDGPLIRVPRYGTGATPLVVYLTAWTCASGSCAQPPSVANGWRLAGRTSVQYTDKPAGVVPGQRAVKIQTWQLAR